MAKTSIDTVRRALFTALAALKDYHEDIVIVGGWVPKIYAWSEDLPEPLIHSFDVDAAAAGAVPVRQRKTITEVLEGVGFQRQEKDAAFALGTFGKKSAQITQFVYKKGRQHVIFEFIAPLIGRGTNDRKTIQRGVVAPALRFVEVLLADTKAIAIEGETLDGAQH